ncbi:peptide-methionine (S)-S-oxide reductase MsrA [Bacteroidia bacterium]|jgi:peptide-methionine (S)-S-oxide reductase|nr:peptide-methionine (S)-S-oxide reductase MsrA [Bacteroidia bacterium]
MKSIAFIGLLGLVLACNSSKKNTITEMEAENTDTSAMINSNAKATFGGGCFWCIETIFAQLKGVDTVLSGYAGGTVKNPSYKEVCTGTTGHAEVIQIHYDSNQISYTDLMEIFFNVHDPTTLNRQGNDVGTQYRSAIMYHNEEQKELAQNYIQQIENSGVFKSKIVTTLEKLDLFYVADDYHQNYYNQNGEGGYCQFVIRPKVEKFQKQYKDKLK